MKLAAKKVLGEHLPYRLTHLDGLVWASEYLLGKRRLGSVELRFDGWSDPFMVTNALVEAGVLCCRLMLEFLGIQLRKRTLAAIPLPRRYPDDFGIEHLGLPLVTIFQFVTGRLAPAAAIRKSTIKVLNSADKGVAHFTRSRSGRAYAHDCRLCAEAVMSAVEQHVYGALNEPVPSYRRWTEARGRRA